MSARVKAVVHLKQITADQEDIVYHGCQGKDMGRFTDGRRWDM
jgi:hypothetical protein